jgi:MFS family permease
MLLVGIGPSLFHPPAIASLSRKFPDKRGLAISLHGAGGSVGEVIGPVLTGALLTGSLLTLTYLVAFTWREVLQISIVPAFASAVVIFLMMRKIPSISSNTGSARDYFSSLFALLRKRAMLILVAVTALRSMGQSAVIAFLPVYLLEDLSFSLGEIALYMAGAQLVGIAAQPVMGYLSDRFGRKVVLIPTLTALGLLYVALKFAEPGPQLLITVLAMGAFLYSLHVIFIAAAMDVSEGEAQSTVVSLIYGASFIGVLSPFLAGLIVDASVTSNAFIFAAVVSLASVVVFAFVKLPKTVNQQASSTGH